MTRIRAKCPTCGDVEFGVDDIVVVGDPTVGRCYRFSCPECLATVKRSAVPDVIDLLITSGVRVDLAATSSILTDFDPAPEGSSTGPNTAISAAKAAHPSGQPFVEPEMGFGSAGLIPGIDGLGALETFTDQDIASFRALLSSPDWFDKLRESGSDQQD